MKIWSWVTLRNKVPSSLSSNGIATPPLRRRCMYTQKSSWNCAAVISSSEMGSNMGSADGKAGKVPNSSFEAVLSNHVELLAAS